MEILTGSLIEIKPQTNALFQLEFEVKFHSYKTKGPFTPSNSAAVTVTLTGGTFEY